MTYDSIDHDLTYLFGRMLGAGSGSELDDLIDTNAIIDADGRSKSKTFFYPDDVDGVSDQRIKQYKRMLRWNEGEGESDRSARSFKADQRRSVQTLCNQSNLNDYQRDRVLAIMKELNINSFGQFSTEHVALGVMTLVANEDRRMLRDEDEFRRVMKSVGASLNDVRTIRWMVRSRTTAFDS